MLSFPPSSLVRVFIGREPIDMRKGVDGLVGLVIGQVQVTRNLGTCSSSSTAARTA
jgi:hypothetical protein